MPQLLELLDLRDKIVTTDAMGCQKALAKTLVAGGGDYILAVKENQPTLHAEIQAAFATAAPAPGRRLKTGPPRAQGPRKRRTAVRLLPNYLAMADLLR